MVSAWVGSSFTRDVFVVRTVLLHPTSFASASRSPGANTALHGKYGKEHPPLKMVIARRDGMSHGHVAALQRGPGKKRNH